MKAYKGFNQDWTCRGFKFEVGKTYKHEGKISLCNSGFHACENPLDILNYYPPTWQMAVVDLLETNDETDIDSKRVGASLKIESLLDIKTLVSCAIEYISAKCNPIKTKHSTGIRSASSATGDNAVAAAFGLESKAKAGGTGVVVVAWWDGKRKRLSVGYVGENGIEADVWYCSDEAGKLVPEDKL